MVQVVKLGETPFESVGLSDKFCGMGISARKKKTSERFLVSWGFGSENFKKSETIFHEF